MHSNFLALNLPDLLCVTWSVCLTVSSIKIFNVGLKFCAVLTQRSNSLCGRKMHLRIQLSILFQITNLRTKKNECDLVPCYAIIIMVIYVISFFLKSALLTPRLSAWQLRGHRVLKSILEPLASRLEDILQPTKSKMSPT